MKMELQMEGEEDSYHCTQPQTTKRSKKGALLNKVNQGSKLSKREPSWGRRKKQDDKGRTTPSKKHTISMKLS